jgi:hypothetical protein
MASPTKLAANERYRQTEAGRLANLEASQRWFRTAAGRAAAARAQQRRRWRRHGITLEQGLALLASQDWSCALGGESLVIATCQVDHDHECCPRISSCGRCIRGLVCKSCNHKIERVERGLTEPTPEIIAYLARRYVEVA